MNSHPSVVAQAAALGPHEVLPLLAPAVITPLQPASPGWVLVAGGGRDLLWSADQIAAALVARTGGQLVHELLHGGARGADRAIGRAAGPIRNHELLELAISRADALEESLVFVLTQLQPAATRFSFPNHELSSRKSSAVVINDEDALDSEWLAVTTTSKPDKASIKEALKAGRQITGAQLLSRRSWRIH